MLSVMATSNYRLNNSVDNSVGIKRIYGSDIRNTQLNPAAETSDINKDVEAEGMLHAG